MQKFSKFKFYDENLFRIIQGYYPHIFPYIVDIEQVSPVSYYLYLDNGNKLFLELTDKIPTIFKIKDSGDYTEEEMKQVITVKLILEMKAHGMSQKDLATATGISEHTISKYTSCQAVPTYKNLRKIALIFDKPVSYFMQY